MLFENIVNRGNMPVLQQVMAFSEERHKVLADNISNIDTIDYQMKDLDTEAFISSLSDAIEHRASRGAGAPLEIKSSRYIEWDRNGRINTTAVNSEPENILFHDKNNRSVEKQMSELAKNGLMYNTAAELLKGQYDKLTMAIRGTM